MSEPTALDAVLTRFFAHLRVQRYSVRTIDNYRGSLTHFAAFLTSAGVHAFHEVTPRHLVSYQTQLLAAGGERGRPLTVNAQANVAGQIKVFFKFLMQTHQLLANPAQELALPRRTARPPTDVLDLAAMRRLLRAPNVRTRKGLRDRAILELLYSTGLRATELANLNTADVVLDEGELTVRRGKGAKDRLVPVGQAACLWVGRYLKESRPSLAKHPGAIALFLNRQGRRLTRRSLSKIVRQRAKAAGLTTKVTPHTLRHTFATHMLRGRASIRHIQEILGHVRLSTTQIYTQVDITDLKREHRRCHPRGRQ